jgi:membrane fusion protein, multidrug efflux system
MKKLMTSIFVLCLASAPLWLASCKLGGKSQSSAQAHQDKTAEIAIPVTVITAKKEDVDIKYQSVGTLSSRKEPIVRSQVAGHVRKILVHEGQAVEQGQTLVVLSKERETIALNQAEAKYLQSKAVFEERKQSLHRKTLLSKRGIVSKSAFDEAVANLKVARANLDVANYTLYNAQYRLAQTDVLSPIQGFVQKIDVSLGDVISPGGQLVKLVNHDKLKAHLPFSENKVSKLKQGQRVLLTSPMNPKEKVSAVVSSISPAINPSNRSIDVVVDIENQHGWRVGSSVHAHVFASNVLKAITVPEQSVVLRPQGMVVFVVEKNRAKARPVTVGYQGDGNIAITSGLKVGDVVVVDGSHYLGDNSLVKIQEANS